MTASLRLLDFYVPPKDDLVLESFVATTYKIDWEFVEEELLATALGVRSSVSRIAAFRAELERRLDSCDVTILHDLRASVRRARLSPRIDPLPLTRRKLHAKITLLLWSAPQQEGEAIRRQARLIVGSANLTRQGFRENYEVVSAIDFGGHGSAPGQLLLGAVDLIADMSKETGSRRLDEQLSGFRQFARDLSGGEQSENQPRRFVTANSAMEALEEVWRSFRESTPQAVIVASPFWPQGDCPGEPVVALVRKFGVPARVELICESAPDAKGSRSVPLLPGGIPSALRAALNCPILIRPSMANYDVGDTESENETGELMEDQRLPVRVEQSLAVRRALHAKIVAVRGARGCALYIGSSNCTRRGFALSGAGTGGSSNWEAGFVYRLGRNHSIVDQLLLFAGPAVEVPADGRVETREPECEPEPPVPLFLHEVVAVGTRITVRLREDEPVPPDLVIAMPDRANPERLFLLLRGVVGDSHMTSHEVALEDCLHVDENLAAVPSNGAAVSVVNVAAVVEVRWNGYEAQFPVRFEDRTLLPPVPGMRRLTESELIEYFLTGHEPWTWDTADGSIIPGKPETGSETSDLTDTRRILSYFVRRFVEAIPGMEAELQRALHSKPALEAALLGPTSPVALAERAVESLRAGPPSGEPKKTPISVGFQLVEIVAVLQRCRERATTAEGKTVLDRGIERCQQILDGLVTEYEQLKDETFWEYRRFFAAEA